MHIKDQFDPELRKKIKSKKQVAIIPIGSIEQHGAHLPISTDSDIVTEITDKIAKKCGFLLLPTISYGVSFEHAPFFNLSVSKSVLQKQIMDICMSLSENSIKTIFIINGHHGNQKALQDIDRKIKRKSKKNVKVFVFSYWHFMEQRFDHAGFVETSLMLAISNKVKMKYARKGLITDNLSQKEIAKLGKLASKSFPAVTKNGVWGNPTKSTKKDGQRFLSEIVTNLTKMCQTCLTGKNPKLHQ